MSTRLYKYTPLSERNDPSPFFVILKIPQKIETELFYKKIINLLTKLYETSYQKGTLPPQSELMLQVNSICLPAIVSWENMLHADGSPLVMEVNKSNTISLEALKQIPLNWKQEISAVIEELVSFGANETIINNHKIDSLTVEIDFLPFTLSDEELQTYIESTFKITISNEDKNLIEMATQLQELREGLDEMKNKRSDKINNILDQIVQLNAIENKSLQDISLLDRLYDELHREKKSIEHNEQKSIESILERYNPVMGGETVLYYLRLRFKGKKYYKVGVTLRNVSSRYTKQDFQYIEKILYEQKVTHANTIEQKVLKDFQDYLFPLAILSSGQSEVFDFDVLGLDV